MNAESSYPSVDLSSCDLEPIHIIGRIQSFGYLVSFSSDWIINHVSANIHDLLGEEPGDVVGMPAVQFIAGAALHEIRSRLQMIGASDTVDRIFGLDLVGNGSLYDLAVHASGRSFILEAEAAQGARQRDYTGYVRPMVDRLRSSGSVEALCEAAARQLRALTGFDRVMVYRFEGDGAGEVVAESVRGSVDSFRGLHFPASDIPAQARKLYTRNILRIIADVNDPTVPIVPGVNPSGEALDLSMSGLRAVSPIHIEYLKNMGVEASMSVSILRQGKLWGLMACHHYAPLRLNYAIRTAAELFGEFMSFLLEQTELYQISGRREMSLRLHDEIMSRVAGGVTLVEAFDDFSESIAKVIPYDSIGGWIGGELVSRGTVPDKKHFAALARFLNTTGASRVWASDNLASIYPDAAEFSECCAGILSLPVSRSPRDYIVLFRKEFLHSVNWAGNPNKPVEYGPNGPRLSPRKSFELWQEERSGYSKPWEEDEVATAENLRVTLLEVVLRMSDAASSDREQASKRQDTLIAELNHRVRNILNLIRGLVAQSRAGVDSVDDFAEIVGDRIHALARAHDQVTRANWSPSSLHDLVLTECKAYMGDNAQRVIVIGTDVLMTPLAFSTLALVIHELMTNSCKYGALSDRRGSVRVMIEKQGAGDVSIVWTEHGGPAVRTPSRRGFGSSIIERAVPHELGGKSEIDFDPKGVVVRLNVPAEHIAAFQNLPDHVASAQSQPPAKDGNAMLSGDVLIVEDNMIIAMEAEDILETMGAERCHVAASAASALDILSRHTITFALLDVNLGDHTSAPVAQALTKAGTPFIFASGYGNHAEEIAAGTTAPVVTKPYSRTEFLAVARKVFGQE